jgi:hypothetical protein
MDNKNNTGQRKEKKKFACSEMTTTTTITTTIKSIPEIERDLLVFAKEKDDIQSPIPPLTPTIRCDARGETKENVRKAGQITTMAFASDEDYGYPVVTSEDVFTRYGIESTVIKDVLDKSLFTLGKCDVCHVVQIWNGFTICGTCQTAVHKTMEMVKRMKIMQNFAK